MQTEDGAALSPEAVADSQAGLAGSCSGPAIRYLPRDHGPADAAIRACSFARASDRSPRLLAINAVPLIGRFRFDPFVLGSQRVMPGPALSPLVEQIPHEAQSDQDEEKADVELLRVAESIDREGDDGENTDEQPPRAAAFGFSTLGSKHVRFGVSGTAGAAGRGLVYDKL
jgi:hypothetical protein